MMQHYVLNRPDCIAMACNNAQWTTANAANETYYLGLIKLLILIYVHNTRATDPKISIPQAKSLRRLKRLWALIFK